MQLESVRHQLDYKAPSQFGRVLLHFAILHIKGRVWREVDAVFKVARGDLVDGDFSGNELGGKGAGEQGDPDFSDMVAGGQFAGGEPIRSRVTKVDDTSPVFGKEGKGGLGGEKSGRCGAVNPCEPGLGAGGEKGGGLVGAGVVDEQIKPTKLAANLLEHPGDLCGLG